MNAASKALDGLTGGKRRRAAAKREGELPVRISGSEYARTTATPSRVLGFDQALIWACVALLAFFALHALPQALLRYKY